MSLHTVAYTLYMKPEKQSTSFSNCSTVRLTRSFSSTLRSLENTNTPMLPAAPEAMPVAILEAEVKV